MMRVTLPGRRGERVGGSESNHFDPAARNTLSMLFWVWKQPESRSVMPCLNVRPRTGAFPALIRDLMLKLCSGS